MSYDIAKYFNLPLETKTHEVLRAANNQQMDYSGTVMLKAKVSGGKSCHVSVIVSKDLKNEILLSWHDLQALGVIPCLLYTSPSPRDQRGSRMPSSA